MAEKKQTTEELQKEIEALKAKNAELEKQVTSKAGNSFSLKIAAKGGISMYGLGRFPTTLYQEQWLMILDNADNIRAFIAANKAQLKSKEQK